MVYRVLPVGFQPNEYDVVCGRGKGSYLQPGNVKFRSIIASYSNEYLTLGSKKLKATYIDLIINKVRMQNHGNARFVKQLGRGGLWVELDEAETRDKVGHSVRAELVQLYGRPVPTTPLPIVQQQQQPQPPHLEKRGRRSIMKATQAAHKAADCFKFEKIPSFNVVGSSSIVETTSPTTAAACIDPFGSHMMTARKDNYGNMQLLCNNDKLEDYWDSSTPEAFTHMMAPIPLLTSFSSSRPDWLSLTAKIDDTDTLMQIPIHDPFPLRSESSFFHIVEEELLFRAEDFFVGSDNILNAIEDDNY